MPRNFTFTGFRENMMYWIIYQPPITQLQLTDLDSPFKYYDSTDYYYFRDYNNILNKSFTQWTIANIVQDGLNIQSTSFNMAWRVQLLCTKIIYDIVINVTDTPEPTTTITLVPTTIITIEPPIHNDNNNNNNTNNTYNKDVLYILLIILLVVIGLLVYIFVYMFKKITKNEDDSNSFVTIVQQHDSAILNQYDTSNENLDTITTKGQQFINTSQIEISLT